jgi:hypothetical protein
MKKILMSLLGTLFALMALAAIPGGLKTLQSTSNITRMIWDTVLGSLLPMLFFGMFSYWSFQSAFKKNPPAGPSDHNP